MSLYSHNSNRISVIPPLDNSVHIFNRTTIEPMEYNSPLCIFYLQQGRIEKKVNNRRLQLSSGDLVIISPGSKVSLSSLADFSGVSAYISNVSLLIPTNYSRSNEYDEAYKMLFSNYNLQKHTLAKLKGYFDHLINESELTESTGSFNGVLEFLKDDIAYYFERLPLVNRKRVTTKLDILQRVENIKMTIERNCVQKFDLDSIAKVSLMSKYALIRNFKEVFQTTPHQYYVLKKISLAKEFLISGMSVKETAHRCGYPDIFSFSKQFKMVEGYSPSKFPLELGEKT